MGTTGRIKNIAVGNITSENIGIKTDNPFLRFGKVPDYERSIDWTKFSNDRQSEIQNLMKNGLNPWDAVAKFYKHPDKYFEQGVSTFKLGTDGLIDLKNFQQVYTLFGNTVFSGPNDVKMVYSLNGTQVGTGRDAEPLLQNVKNVKEHTLTFDIVQASFDKAIRNNYNKSEKITEDNWYAYTYKDASYGHPISHDGGKTVYWRGKIWTEPVDTWRLGIGGFKPTKWKKKK